jgi:putative spermidine/putrescine transport system ATP-binding protein
VTHDQEEALTMSDRLAVFNNGRIEQVGPPAEVYEHPETEFVAGFVGVSNVLHRTLNGQPSRFTVRPEKIRILEESDTAEAGTYSETGKIRDVVYVGMVTRYAVELDEGGVLMVIRQNLETTSGEALEARGRRVRLTWRPEDTYAIETGEEEEQHE